VPHLPLFPVQARIDEIPIQNNFYRDLALKSKKIRKQPSTNALNIFVGAVETISDLLKTYSLSFPGKGYIRNVDLWI